MPIPGGVLDEDDIATAESSLLAGGHFDLDFAVEQHDQLSLRGAVPVEVPAGCGLTEHDALRRPRLGRSADRADVDEIDVDLRERRAALRGARDASDLHGVPFA